jgi:hypothetical protein
MCVTIFMCSPVSAFWDQEDFLLVASGKYEYKCMNEGAEIVSNGVLSTIQVRLLHTTLIPSPLTVV